MKKMGMFTGFLPWLAFDVIAQRLAANAVAWSAVIAIAMMASPYLTTRGRARPRILNIGGLALFSVIAIVGFVGDRHVDLWLYRWGVPLVGVVLGAYVLLTARFAPFTAEYARQMTPQEHWHTPTFVKINRVLSEAWGVAILVVGLMSVASAALRQRPVDSSSAHLAELLLGWVLPMAILWFMIKFTESYPDRVTAPAQAPAVRADAGVQAAH